MKIIVWTALAFAVLVPQAQAQCQDKLPAAAQTVLRQMGEKFAELRQGTDADRRQWTLKAAEQLAFSVSPSYGTKRASPTRPQSSDAVARYINGTLCGWDVIFGEHPYPLQFGNGIDLTGQVFIPVTPKNHLQIGSAPPDVPSPPVSTDLDAVVEMLASLESRIVRIEHESLQAALRAAEIQAQLAEHDRNLTEHRKVAKEELDKAKSFGRKLAGGLLRNLPAILAAVAGYVAK